MALVIDLQAFLYRAFVHGVRPLVSHPAFLSCCGLEVSVSIGAACALPYPTAVVVGFDLSLEACELRSVHGRKANVLT